MQGRIWRSGQHSPIMNSRRTLPRICYEARKPYPYPISCHNLKTTFIEVLDVILTQVKQQT